MFNKILFASEVNVAIQAICTTLGLEIKIKHLQIFVSGHCYQMIRALKNMQQLYWIVYHDWVNVQYFESKVNNNVCRKISKIKYLPER